MYTHYGEPETGPRSDDHTAYGAGWVGSDRDTKFLFTDQKPEGLPATRYPVKPKPQKLAADGPILKPSSHVSELPG